MAQPHLLGDSRQFLVEYAHEVPLAIIVTRGKGMFGTQFLARITKKKTIIHHGSSAFPRENGTVTLTNIIPRVKMFAPSEPSLLSHHRRVSDSPSASPHATHPGDHICSFRIIHMTVTPDLLSQHKSSPRARLDKIGRYLGYR